MSEEPDAVEELLQAAEFALHASSVQWLYLTGQFSRRATPPRDYPPQGSMHGICIESDEKLRKAILRFREPRHIPVEFPSEGEVE